MKLRDFYLSAVDAGMRHDPRGQKGVSSYLEGIRKGYKALSEKEKGSFDREKFTNPYSDTRILFGSPSAEIRTIIAGIDMEAQEIMLADMLKKRGIKIDLVLAHHPEGFARSVFYEVMNVQYDILKDAGVSAKKAKELLDERMEEVARKLLSANAMRPVDTARLLNIPYMCAHTVADNFASDYINKLIAKNKPRTISDIIELLEQEPEYRYAISTNAGPKLIHGKPSDKCGKALVEMTGGTEGSKKIFPELKKAGIKTLIGMHMSEEHFKKAKKYKFNILVAGHISSDTLGINLLLDAVDPKNSIKVIECSGFRRFRRR